MNKRIYTIIFADAYPLYFQKAEKKGRTKAEVDTVIKWLTGYDDDGLQMQIDKGVTLETFFNEAPVFNPNAKLITGSICGYKVEEIADSLEQKVRYLDKLIDELAKGKPFEKVLRGQRQMIQYEVAVSISDNDYERLIYSNQTRYKQTKLRRYFFDWDVNPYHPDYNFVVSIVSGDGGVFLDHYAWIRKDYAGKTQDRDDFRRVCCGNIINNDFGNEAVAEDGSHGLYQIKAQITEKDALDSIIGEGMSRKLSVDILGTGTPFYYVDYVDTTQIAITTESGLEIDANMHLYKGIMESEVIFKYKAEEGKEDFFKYLKERRIQFVPLTKTIYARLIEKKVSDSRKKIKQAEAEVRAAKKEVIERYKREIDGLKSDVSYLCGIIKNAKDLSQAQDVMNKYLLRGGAIRKERNVPVDFNERAKFLLQHYKEDADRIAFCDSLNKSTKTFVYIGLSRREYILIKRDHKLLDELFGTTLVEYKEAFEQKFKMGLSLAKFAKKHLSVKTKKAGENTANRIYAALAAELKRIHEAQTRVLQEKRSNEKLLKIRDKEQDMVTAAFLESRGDKSYYEALVRGYGELEDLYDNEDE
jgi:hypothetical protein